MPTFAVKSTIAESRVYRVRAFDSFALAYLQFNSQLQNLVKGREYIYLVAHRAQNSRKSFAPSLGHDDRTERIFMRALNKRRMYLQSFASQARSVYRSTNDRENVSISLHPSSFLFFLSFREIYKVIEPSVARRLEPVLLNIQGT